MNKKYILNILFPFKTLFWTYEIKLTPISRVLYYAIISLVFLSLKKSCDLPVSMPSRTKEAYILDLAPNEVYLAFIYY